MADEKRGFEDEQKVPNAGTAPPPYTPTASFLPPAQEAYPPKQDTCPPVYTQQPTPTVVDARPRVQPCKVDDHYTLSYWLSVLWCFTAPWLLCCTIPALRKSKECRRAKLAGDYVTAKEKANSAILLNFISIMIGFGGFLIFVSFVLPVVVGVAVPLATIFGTRHGKNF